MDDWTTEESNVGTCLVYTYDSHSSTSTTINTRILLIQSIPHVKIRPMAKPKTAPDELYTT